MTLRISKCVLNRNPHIRRAKLSYNAMIGKFHKRMDDAFRMDYYVDIIVGQAKQPMGLNHLKPFVHHRCGINRYFCAHGPVGMIQGLLHRDALKLGTGAVAERAA
ncbi:hypothetical protein D3C78_1620970 [compost metagenome]